jgi:glycosyltransferase involved in cell wall biosynthesis
VTRPGLDPIAPPAAAQEPLTPSRRILVLSSVFPSEVRPTYGVFVQERVRRLARHCDIVVVAPIPWFPGNRWLRDRAHVDTPFREHRQGLSIYHPRYFCFPAIGKSLDGVLYFLSLVPFVAWLRRRFAFDVIDAHFTYPDGLGGVLLGRVFRRPTVVTVRGTHDMRHAGYVWRRPQIRYALRAASAVIAVSESLRRFAVSLGLREEDVRVIPNGVDRSRFFPSDRRSARETLALPQDRVILLAVGSLTEGKGHHLVIETLRQLLAQYPSLLYIALGNEELGGQYRRRLDDLISREGLDQNVRIVSQRPHDEIRLWLAAADLFCLATRSEGWCNAIMEALACGVPVVTTLVGGNAELVRDGHDGLLVPYWDRQRFAESVSRALDTAWDRDAIARRAAERGWDRVAQEVVELFTDAIPAADGLGIPR